MIAFSCHAYRNSAHLYTNEISRDCRSNIHGRRRHSKSSRLVQGISFSENNFPGIWKFVCLCLRARDTLCAFTKAIQNSPTHPEMVSCAEFGKFLSLSM
uniref:Uncharacterized protein n=1 Tax=Physcomitrium patens TaxID=3218 RepID=A0A2K1K0B5_PHYPA|nr:hypothetical protein PHYPA_014343 [Physcomitrium patens]